jgi:glucan phosphoethanolaminetransferase (alkaline phosphatase superfamily)
MCLFLSAVFITRKDSMFSQYVHEFATFTISVISMIMKAACSSETLVNIYQSTHSQHLRRRSAIFLLWIIMVLELMSPLASLWISTNTLSVLDNYVHNNIDLLVLCITIFCFHTVQRLSCPSIPSGSSEASSNRQVASSTTLSSFKALASRGSKFDGDRNLWNSSWTSAKHNNACHYNNLSGFSNL